MRWRRDYSDSLIFYALLVNRKQSYILNVFLGRLPSLVCGIFSIPAAFFFMRKNMNGKVIVFPIILITLFWENIIYTAKAEPYVIVVLCGFLILFFLQANEYRNRTKS